LKDQDNPQSAGYLIFVIGASAGGVETLIKLVERLPEDLPAAVFIVVHIKAAAKSYLPKILSKAGRLPAFHPSDGEEIKPGRIYIAPPNQHLVLSRERIFLTSGPKEHGHRPAIDPLFHSAALNYGPRVVGIVLSGMLGDGSAGLFSIKSSGGLAVVQDPQEAVFPSMPLSALGKVDVDHVLDIAGIASLMDKLPAGNAVREGLVSMKKNPDDERMQISRDFERFKQGEKIQHNSVLSCPDCGGVIFEMGEQDQPHFRCHIGHSYSLESYMDKQSESLEDALWKAVRILEERAALLERIAYSLEKKRAGSRSGKNFSNQALEVRKTVDIIRQAIAEQPDPSASFYISSTEDMHKLDDSAGRELRD
jgi:two-component system, chemotaxis family, protein-glutamate methylesterase/glutaminase